MPFDYIADFPLPADLIPARLRALLEPIGMSPLQRVDVTTSFEKDMYGPDRECVHLLMAVVPENGQEVTSRLDEDGHGVVAYSVPFTEKGAAKDTSPSISGHDYIVASWGNGSFYSYNLAEKVWMTLGLTPRSVGNDDQRIIYDDLSLPEFGVANGEISNQYYFTSKRNVNWTMSNEYLRKYLYLRGALGVRVFYYQTLLPDVPQIRGLMDGRKHVLLKPADGWYELDIREHNGALLIQLWATVIAVSPELCPEQTANGILWPDIDGPMTHSRAGGLVHYHDTMIFLDDRFLERYEQSAFYDSRPVNVHGQWHCSPSYLGQWDFSDCVRVGRNLIRVPIRELYKPKPDREILHAHAFARSRAEIAHLNLDEEHIAAKTQRLVDQLLDLGDNLARLAGTIGIHRSGADLVKLSRVELQANGWFHYPQLCRLAQVAPIDMSQSAFLARCKSLHELWQCVPNGFLRSLLKEAGCAAADVKDLGSLKLLQAVLNIVTKLNAAEENSDAFATANEPEGWDIRNPAMASLFLNHDLRIADAHEAIGDCLKTLEEMGFDIATVNQGYGLALDFVMDRVIAAFATINSEISTLLISP